MSNNVITGKDSAGATDEVGRVGNALQVAAPYPTTMTTAQRVALDETNLGYGYAVYDTDLKAEMVYIGDSVTPNSASDWRYGQQVTALGSSNVALKDTITEGTTAEMATYALTLGLNDKGVRYGDTTISKVYVWNGTAFTEDLVVEGGAINVISYASGQLISQAALTLTAASQPLPTVPAGTRSAIIQTHGGTVTDRIYISLDGTDATTADFQMKNVGDTTANIGGPTEMQLGGNLDNVRVLGTANSSVMVVWYFA